ncbi:MAG: hypothetical protein AAGA25_16115 [Planctomycetota bacterium]
MQTLLLLHAAATLYMTGLIWFVQRVHYPLMGCVGESGYAHYQREHQRRTGWAVGPAMLIELGCAVTLCLVPQATEPRTIAWVGLALLAILWLSTGLLQVPCHRKLAQGFDRHTHRKLVQTNWLRTVCWSLRGVLALLLLL